MFFDYYHRLLALTVNPAANFSLSATAASVTPGGTGTSTITVTPTGGFTGTVTFAASGLPTGVTGSFSGDVVTFTASSTAATGSSTVTITGTSGTLAHTATLTLTVNPTANFSLSATAASVTQGGTGTSTITVTPTAGFGGTVTFAVSGLPTGVTASFSGDIVTFTAPSTAATGPSTVTITGTSGTLSHTATLTLTVNATANFSLSATAASVTPGGTGTSTITVTPTGGFTGNVTFAASGLPTGVTASFSGDIATFTASSTAAAGSSTVTITGTSGTLSHTATLTLTVAGGNGGVTVTTVVNSNSPYFDDEGIKLSNTTSITSLSITITIQNTGGLTYSGEYNTVGGSISQTHSSTASALVYQYSLSSGQTLGAGSGWLFDAQAGGSGTAHPATGDTYSVTYVTGGQSFTVTGVF
jgi:hypothetical protein